MKTAYIFNKQGRRKLFLSNINNKILTFQVLPFQNILNFQKIKITEASPK